MYKKKIIASLDKLANGELKDLWEKIQFHYVLDTGEKAMLRDDIRDKIFELMKAYFVWITTVELYEKHELYKDLTILQPDVYDFANDLEIEFGLEEIAFATTMNWKTVADIVNYIEDQLEGKDDESK